MNNSDAQPAPPAHRCNGVNDAERHGTQNKCTVCGEYREGWYDSNGMEVIVPQPAPLVCVKCGHHKNVSDAGYCRAVVNHGDYCRCRCVFPPAPEQPIPPIKECGGYYCDENVGHIDCQPALAAAAPAVSDEAPEPPERIWTVGGTHGSFFTKQGHFATVEYARVREGDSATRASTPAGQDHVHTKHCFAGGTHSICGYIEFPASASAAQQARELARAIVGDWKQTDFISALNMRLERLVDRITSALEDRDRSATEAERERIERVINGVWRTRWYGQATSDAEVSLIKSVLAAIATDTLREDEDTKS